HSAAEEEAYKISQDKGSTGEFTQEQRDAYYARQRAIDDLRKGNSKGLEEGLEKGTIKPKEIKTLIRRSIGSPLFDRVIGFSYEQTKQVFDKATPKEQEELYPLLMDKYRSKISGGEQVEAPEEVGIQ